MTQRIWMAAWLSVVALMIGAAPGAAETTGNAVDQFSLDRMEKAFTQQTAMVIDGPQGHVMLNQGSAQGIKQGDLWTLFLPARPVKDPESGEILGEFSPPAAVARVKKVHERFSEVDVRCLDEKHCAVSSGMKAVRYQQIKAWFTDEKKGAAADIYPRLRARLDHLDWQSHEPGSQKNPDQEPFAYGVVFSAAPGKLTVWSGGQVHATYRLEGQAPVPARPAAHKPAAGMTELPGMGGPLEVSGFEPVTSLDQRIRHMGIARSSSSGTPYLVFLSKRSISAQSLENDDSFDYDYSGFGRIVSMSASGGQLLAVSIYDPDAGMRSMLLEVTDRGFEKKAEGIAYLLAFIKGTNPDQPPQLWGQRFSHSDLLLPVVYQLNAESDSVSRGRRIDVPHGFSLMGAFSCDINGNGIAELGFFNAGGQLVVYEQGEPIWESSEKFAGSHGSILITDPQYPDAAPAKLDVWGQPAVFSVNNRICAALPLNQAGLSTMIGGGPSRGTVGIFCGQKASYRLGQLADRFQGLIQDVFVHKDKLLICVAEGGFFSQKGRSHLLSVPLSSLVPEN